MKKSFSFLYTILVVLLMQNNAFSEERGFPHSTLIWNKLNIPVCWVNPTNENARNRIVTREAIASSWEANSDVRFTGWGKCSSNIEGIKILIQDRPKTVSDEPKVNIPRSYVGTISKRYNPSMHLNFTFQHWPLGGNGEAFLFDTSAPDKEDIIHSIAIHEFGHALGFAHEQDRSDASQECLDSLQDQEGNPYVADIYGNTFVGDWDRDSIMNYCYGSSYNQRISDTDIEMVKRFYTDPTPIANFDSASYSVPLKVETRFSANNSKNASVYKWKFSTKSIEDITYFPYIDYIYNAEGSYYLDLIVSDGSQDSESKRANIYVYDPIKVLIPVFGLLL